MGCKCNNLNWNILTYLTQTDGIAQLLKDNLKGRTPYLEFCLKLYLSEVIVHDCILINTDAVKIVCNSLDEHWRSTEVVLTILWCLVIL